MPRNYVSILLVIIQLVTLLYILFSGPLIPQDSIMLLLLIAGVALGIWAVYSFRITRFSLLSEIPENAALVTAGPYRVIRHPMYTSVLLIATALVVNEPTASRFLALLILAIVLLIKTETEERYLDKHFKEYGSYKVNTQKLIPFLF